MGNKIANTYIDYQARAKEFKVGLSVYRLLGGTPWSAGTVVAVWPAIGMVDVEWPNGTSRVPVEDLQIKDKNSVDVVTPSPDGAVVPAGIGTNAPVSSGPEKDIKPDDRVASINEERIAAANKVAELAERRTQLRELYAKLTHAWLRDDFEALHKMTAINDEQFRRATTWKTRNAGWVRNTTDGLEDIGTKVAKIQARLVRELKKAE